VALTLPGGAGFTPLHIAATAGRVDIIDDLLARGAAIEARTNGGDTPLFQTVPLASGAAFVRLLEKGARLDARNNAGQSILRFALEWQRPAMADLILSRDFKRDPGDPAAPGMLDEAANAGVETLVTALGAAVNEPSNEYMPSADRDGNLYFERHGLNVARWRDGAYQPAEPVSGGLTNVANPGHPFVAPDGSYLLFDAALPGTAKGVLFVSFQMKDGGWSPAVRLFEQADTRSYESCPSVSPDGKALFFGRDHDIWWVSADVIDARRPPGAGPRDQKR
jgi:hypothetical protein